MSSYYLIFTIVISCLFGSILELDEKSITHDSVKLNKFIEVNEDWELWISEGHSPEELWKDELNIDEEYGRSKLKSNTYYTITIKDSKKEVIESRTFCTLPKPINGIKIPKDKIAADQAQVELILPSKINKQTEYQLRIYNESDNSSPQYFDNFDRTLTIEPIWFKINNNKVFTLKQLNPNNRYRIMVESRNLDKERGKSKEESFSTLASEISSIEYRDISDSRAKILINDENNSNTEYLIKVKNFRHRSKKAQYYHSDSTFGSSPEWIGINSESEDLQSPKILQLNNLESNSKYTVTVQARNYDKKRTEESSTEEFTTLSSPITEFAAIRQKNKNDNSIIIRIEDKNHSATKYQLKIISNPDTDEQSSSYYVSDNEKPKNEPQWANIKKKNKLKIDGLKPNTIYNFEIKARNDNIKGPPIIGETREFQLCTDASPIKFMEVKENTNKYDPYDQYIIIDITNPVNNYKHTTYLTEVQGITDPSFNKKFSTIFKNRQKHLSISGLVPENKYRIKIKPVNQHEVEAKYYEIEFETTRLRSLENFISQYNDRNNVVVTLNNDGSVNTSAIINIFHDKESIGSSTLEIKNQSLFNRIIKEEPGSYLINAYNKIDNSDISSSIIEHRIKIEDQFIERKQSNYSIPETKLEGKVGKNDSLIIYFSNPTNRVKQKIRKVIRDQGKFKFDDYKDGKFIFISKSELSTYAVPHIEWPGKISPKQPSYIGYEIRRKLKQNATSLNDGISHIHRLHYSELEFAVKDFKRYESIKTDEDALLLPTLQMTQTGTGKNILREGDQLKISFAPEISDSIKWRSTEMDEDDYFNIKEKEGSLIFTVLKDRNSWPSYDFPDLYFSLESSQSFEIKLQIQMISNDRPEDHGWNYTVANRSHGLKVGKLNLEEVAHTPIYESNEFDSYPDATIASVRIVPEEHALLFDTDVISLNIEGANFDLDRDWEIKTPNIRKHKTTATSVSFKVTDQYKNNFIQDIVLEHIPIVKKDVTPSDIRLTVSIEGKEDQYSQETEPKKNHFHLGDTKELYFEYTDTPYLIPSTLFTNIDPLNSGDTLYVRAEDIILQKEYFEKILSKHFRYIESNDSSMAFEYKTKSSSKEKFDIDALSWKIEFDDMRRPEYLEYELRYKDNGGKASSRIYRLDYSELEFTTIDKFYRCESIKTDGTPLLLPRIQMNQMGDGENILREGDQLTFSFASEIRELITWDWFEEDDYFSIEISPTGNLIFTVLENHESWPSHLFPKIYFRLNSSESFEIKVNINMWSKSTKWTETYTLNESNEDYSLNVGRPKLIIDKDSDEKDIISGLILNRSSNRLPRLTIKTNNTAYTRVGDTLSIRIREPGINFFTGGLDQIRLSGSAQSKIKMLPLKEKNEIQFKVSDHFSDGDNLIIDNLRIQKIIDRVEEINLLFSSSATPITNKSTIPLKAATYQDIQIEVDNNNPSYRFAYDEKKDFVRVILKNYDPNIKTFWDDDYLELYLDKTSGVIWDSQNINSQKYAPYTNTLKRAQIRRISIEKMILKDEKEKWKNTNLNDKDILLGSYELLESKSPSNYYHIYKIIENSGELTTDYPIPPDGYMDHFYSKLDFDLVDDYGVYSKVKSKTPFTLPDIKIYQKNESSLKENDSFSIELDPRSNLNFSHDMIPKPRNAELVHERMNDPHRIKFKVKKVYDPLKPIIISDLEASLTEPDYSDERNAYNITFNYDRYINEEKKEKYTFKSEKKIFISSPFITTSNDTLIWPENELMISEIIIDDTESRILGYDTDQILIRLEYDENIVIKDLSWASLLEEEYEYEISKLDPRVLSIPINRTDNGRRISLSNLYLTPLENFDDIKKDAKIKIKFSFDDGRNFYEENQVLDIWRINDIGFSSNCRIDVNTKKQYLPTLRIVENSEHQTVQKGTELFLEIQGKALQWSGENSLINDIQIKAGDQIIDLDDMFEIRYSKNKIKLIFNRSMTINEQIRIKNLSITQIDKFESAHIAIYYGSDNNNIDLIAEKFSIKSGDLIAQIFELDSNNRKIYSLRDSEREIKSTQFLPVEESSYDKLPPITFKESGQYPYLEKGDMIKLISPFDFENLRSDTIKQEINKFINKSSIFSKVESGSKDNIIELTVKENTEKDQSFKIPDFLLKFNYPDKSFIQDSIRFIVIKKSYQREDSINYESVDGAISLSSGQPIFDFVGDKKRYKEYIKNTPPDTLPWIRIKEDDLLQNIKKERTITFVLNNNFPASWHYGDHNISSDPPGYFEENSFVVSDDKKSAEIQIKKTMDLGETVILKGLMIENFTDISLNKTEEPIMRISMDNYSDDHRSTNTNPYQFGYDFYQDEGWQNTKIGIGEALIKWDWAETWMEESNEIDIEINDFSIIYNNIAFTENIPDTFYLQLNTYNDGKAKSKRTIKDAELNPSLDVFLFKDKDEQSGVSGIVVDRLEIDPWTNQAYINKQTKVKESWIRCYYQDMDSKRLTNVKNLKMTSSFAPHEDDTKKSWYDITLHYTLPYSSLDSRPSEIIAYPTSTSYSESAKREKRVLSEVKQESESCTKDKIGTGNKLFYAKKKKIKLKMINQNDLESHDADIKFTNYAGLDPVIRESITDENIIVATGTIYPDSIVFVLDSLLHPGIPYEINNINFDFIENSDNIRNDAIGVGLLSIAFDAPSGEQEYYFNKTYIHHKNHFREDDEIKGKNTKGDKYDCFLAKIPQASFNNRKLSLTFEIVPFDIRGDVVWETVTSEKDENNREIKSLLKELYGYRKDRVLIDEEIALVQSLRSEINGFVFPKGDQTYGEELLMKDLGYQFLMAMTYWIEAENCNKSEGFQDHWKAFTVKLGGAKKDKVFVIDNIDSACKTPEVVWNNLEEDLEQENWFNIDIVLYERDKSKMEKELIDKYMDFDFKWDKYTIESAIGFNDITGIKRTQKTTKLAQSLLNNMSNRLQLYKGKGAYNYSDMYKELNSKWKEKPQEDYNDWGDTYQSSDENKVSFYDSDANMLLNYSSNAEDQINSFINSSNYYTSLKYRCDASKEKYDKIEDCKKECEGSSCKKVQGNSERYNMTLYPRLDSNLDWSPVDIYPGAEFLVYHNYQEDVSAQIAYLRIAKWVIIGTTLAKIGIHEYYEKQ